MTTYKIVKVTANVFSVVTSTGAGWGTVCQGLTLGEASAMYLRLTRTN